MSIEHLTHHFKPAYADHQKFGEYIHSYKPNSKNWYIIYDIDNNKDIRIKKIMSSGITKSAV
ncbi:MAG: hypothetical protein LBN27_08940 [Prevotellaceae bacterium]|nr:hypothetical protein [Prevotellaceae bacterium]